MLIDVIRIKAFFIDFVLELAFGTIVFVEVGVAIVIVSYIINYNSLYMYKTGNCRDIIK